jgi:alkyldihydroxyacetonephosphate synthase
VGSEGTLGIITKVTLTVKKLPEARYFRAFLFKDLTSGLEAGRRIMGSGLKPSVIRLYDEAETKSLVKRVLGIDREGSYLVFGVEGYKEIARLEFDKASGICKDAGGEDLGEEPGDEWWKNRYKFFFPPYAFKIPQAFGTCDTVATFTNIEKVYRAMKKAAESKFPDVRFIGHFSHWFEWGCMLYARFIFDDPPGDIHESIQQYNSAWNETVRAALDNGGVINEHHGVGLKLSRLVKEQYGNSFTILKDLKESLDPNGILNPYKFGFGTKNIWS